MPPRPPRQRATAKTPARSARKATTKKGRKQKSAAGARHHRGAPECSATSNKPPGAPLDGDEEAGDAEKSGALTVNDCRRFGAHLRHSTGRKKFAGQRAEFAWLLQTLTGRRGKDVRALRWEDVPETFGRIRIGDSKCRTKAAGPAMANGSQGGPVWCPICPTAPTLATLREFRAESIKRAHGHTLSGPIFPFDYHAQEKLIRRARTTFRPADAESCAAGAITSHTPRRSFCTNMIAAHVAPTIVQKMSGHRSTSSFMRYVAAGYGFRHEAAKQLQL